MEITINYDGRRVTVEVSIEVAECLEEGRRKEENLHHEQRRHWDDREVDEYIIATEGRLPYCATPEELLCQQDTLDEILIALALCTPPSGSGFCSMRSMISAMRRLPRCVAAPRAR